MILILSGPIRSYKTTTLMQWADRRDDCGGVLSPDVDGLRQLFNVREKTSIGWQKSAHSHPSDMIVGRFVFDAHAFHQAEEWLDDHLMDDKIRYLLLDEVGPLELSGKGWDSWLRSALLKIAEKTLILVVRDFLLDDVIRRYHLEDAEVISREYFVE